MTGITIRPRSDWGAAPPLSRLPLNAQRAQVHWEGTTVGLTDPGHVPLVIKATQRFHVESRDMSDIAYNLLVDPWGTIWSGRGLGVRSGANGTTLSNHENLAVCVLLGEGDPPAGDAVFTALAHLRDELGLPLIAHRDVKPTECPGDHIAAWVHAHAVPLPAVHLPAPTVPQEDRMLIVRNVESEAIHTLAERTGLGPNVGSLAVVDELIASGIVAARPDGAKWIDLSDAAFRALPVA